MYEARIFSHWGRTFVRDALLWHQHAQKFTAQVLAWLLKGGQLFVGRRWRRQIAKNMPSNEPRSTRTSNLYRLPNIDGAHRSDCFQIWMTPYANKLRRLGPTWARTAARSHQLVAFDWSSLSFQLFCRVAVTELRQRVEWRSQVVEREILPKTKALSSVYRCREIWCQVNRSAINASGILFQVINILASLLRAHFQTSLSLSLAKSDKFPKFKERRCF